MRKSGLFLTKTGMDEFKKRISELNERAEERGYYVYTDFLTPTEQSVALSMRISSPIFFWGGDDAAERKIARLGDCCYEEEFPLKILKISPVNKKYCRRLTHRDFLGAILNQGVDRGKIGDIFTDGFTAFVICSDTLVEFFIQNLTKVGGNNVCVELADKVEEGLLPRTEEVKFPVSSVRLDAIICKAYNLSREGGAELHKKGLVSANGRVTESPAYTPKEGEVVAVRGYGKFVFIGECGVSAKGKIYVKIKRYI